MNYTSRLAIGVTDASHRAAPAVLGLEITLNGRSGQHRFRRPLLWTIADDQTALYEKA